MGTSRTTMTFSLQRMQHTHNTVSQYFICSSAEPLARTAVLERALPTELLRQLSWLG